MDERKRRVFNPIDWDLFTVLSILIRDICKVMMTCIVMEMPRRRISEEDAWKEWGNVYDLGKFSEFDLKVPD